MKQYKDKQRNSIGHGNICRKCRSKMIRYQHSKNWIPQSNSYYFKYWDKCRKCKYLQHYEIAKVYVGDVEIWDE